MNHRFTSTAIAIGLLTGACSAFAAADLFNHDQLGPRWGDHTGEWLINGHLQPLRRSPPYFDARSAGLSSVSLDLLGLPNWTAGWIVLYLGYPDQDGAYVSIEVTRRTVFVRCQSTQGAYVDGPVWPIPEALLASETGDVRASARLDAPTGNVQVVLTDPQAPTVRYPFAFTCGAGWSFGTGIGFAPDSGGASSVDNFVTR